MLELLQKIDALAIVEQVVAVPTISLDRTVGGSAFDRILFLSAWAYGAQRRHSSSSWSVAIGAVEGGLQGLRPGQISTALGGAVHVDNPVPGGRGGRVGHGGLQGVSQGQGWFNSVWRSRSR